MLIDNFEQHFESCVLNSQNAHKSAQNQINEHELMKIFCGFRVFEYALWQKTKMLEINRKLSKLKNPIVNSYHY